MQNESALSSGEPLFVVSMPIKECELTVALDSSFFDEDDDFSFPYHSHAEYELHIATKGRGTLMVGEREVRMSPGMCCIIPPNTYHMQIADEGEAIGKHCVRFSVRARGQDESIVGALFKPTDAALAWRDEGDVLELVRRIQRELSEDRLLQHTLVRACFTELFVSAIRTLSDGSDRGDLASNASQEHNKIARIEFFFNANYARAPRVEDLACELFVSRRQVAREMHRYFGMSFTEKLAKTRMEVARGMLEGEGIKIEDIALSVGYESISSFSSAFRRVSGMAPSEYRRQAALRRALGGATAPIDKAIRE